jgi:hypothetical protein
MREGRIARSVVDSLSRLNVAKSQVASGVDTGPVKEHVDKLSRPKSPSSTLKKAGLALIVGAPDPITAVPGVALIATSYAIKGREPAKLDDIAAETKKILRDIQSLSL